MRFHIYAKKLFINGAKYNQRRRNMVTAVRGEGGGAAWLKSEGSRQHVCTAHGHGQRCGDDCGSGGGAGRRGQRGKIGTTIIA